MTKSVGDAFTNCLAKVASLTGSDCHGAPCAPDMLAGLRKNVPVTAEIVEYLAITDGDRELLSPYELMSASEIQTEYARLMSPIAGGGGGYPEWHFEAPKPFMFDQPWRAGWVPIAQQNYEAYIFVDTEPGPGGTLGQVGLCDDALELTLIAESLLAFFLEFPNKVLAPDHEDNPLEGGGTYLEVG